MTAHKDRTARIGRESGWDCNAPEGEEPAEGDADCEEDRGRVETVNREDVEDAVEVDAGVEADVVDVDAGVRDDESVCDLDDEGADDGGADGGGVDCVAVDMGLPTVIVTFDKLPVREREAGTEKVSVAEARGEENEPDIPVRVKKGENAAYWDPFTFSFVEMKAI